MTYTRMALLGIASAASSSVLAALPTGSVAAPETMVFESRRTEDAEGTVLSSEVRGDLDEQTAQRAGRPWSYFHESTLVREEAWASSLDGTRTHYGYRVTRSNNPSPIYPILQFGPPQLAADFDQQLTRYQPDELVPLALTARNLPVWDIPLRASIQAAGATELTASAQARQQAKQDRAQMIRKLLQPIEEAIASLGGEVVASGTLDGWIAARLPARSVSTLTARLDLFQVEILSGKVREHAPYLDKVRSSPYSDSQQFQVAGYLGERSNPTRHGFGDITVGVVELGLLEDEACFLFDEAGCSGPNRLADVYRCDDLDRDGNYCEPVSSMRDTDDNSGHATAVTSTIGADYNQGQGDPHPLGDSNWSPDTGHSSSWKEQNTGIAPEASLVFFGQMADNDSDDGTTTSPALADAFDDAGDLLLDITNSSWGWNSNGSTSCSLTAVAPHELELENAFDDGVLMVVSAGNPNFGFCASDIGTTCNDDSDCTAVGGTCDTAAEVCNNDPGTECDYDSDCSGVGGPCIAHTSACNIGSPADLPKAFAVNAYNGGETNCGEGTTQTNCYLDADYSANGGINAVSNGSTCTGCVSGIALTTANRFAGTTTPAGQFGSAGATFVGTSAAAPVVAGSAALVKDWLLAAGQSWVNSPGRLHTVMLSMGDRVHRPWGGSRTTLSVGASQYYGHGRMKLRLFEGSDLAPWGYNIVTPSFTPASSDVIHFPFPNPIPTGTEIVKCVLNQYEDMSNKSEISRLDLELRLKDSVAGSCISSGATRYTWIDSGVEVKHMSAITSSQTTLAGRCLEVTIDKEFVTPAGITASLFCYYAGKLDDAY